MVHIEAVCSLRSGDRLTLSARPYRVRVRYPLRNSHIVPFARELGNRGSRDSVTYLVNPFETTGVWLWKNEFFAPRAGSEPKGSSGPTFHHPRRAQRPGAHAGEDRGSVAAQGAGVVAAFQDKKDRQPQAADAPADFVEALGGDASGTGWVGFGDVEAERGDECLVLETLAEPTVRRTRAGP